MMGFGRKTGDCGCAALSVAHCNGPFGLGYNPRIIDRIIKERESAQAIAEKTEPLRASRRPTKEESVNNPDVVRVMAYGNNAEYLTARIARDPRIPYDHGSCVTAQGISAAPAYTYSRGA